MPRRRPLRILLLCALPALLANTGTCVLIAPLDGTKVVLATNADPTFLIVSSQPASLVVTALIAFNSSLDTGSVRVYDVTPGQAPLLLGGLAQTGITPTGVLFRGTLQVDASAPGSRRIQVSAAYAGDPRRARSEPVDVPIVAPLLASLRPAATPAG